MNITLPDGSVRSFDGPITGLELAQSIGTGLAKAALAITLNGEQKDLSTTITEDAEVSIITADSEEGLEIMRHTVAAQVLARAVKNLYPSAKLAIGPTIDNGFYYDIAFEKALSPEDLPVIEKEMRRIVEQSHEIELKMHSRKEVMGMFGERNETYKMDIVERTEDQDEFQIYHQGDTDFIDLCRGPHLPSLKKIGVFKLLSIAGAYWRGDSNNEMLTRIYGTAWKNEKDLKKHLAMLEEAGKRDHRKIGPVMGLFHLQDCAPGQVFWHHKGWQLYRQLENYMRDKCLENQYIEVNTPQVMDVEIWKTSGHWDKFRDNMMTQEDGDRTFGLKPMSCPGNIQVYKQGLVSYRDLPIRMAEFGRVFRNEASGAIHGIMRVKAFTQDDAHSFCTPEQIVGEVQAMVELIREVYTDMGFADFRVKLSDRPEMRLGTDEIWDESEQALKDACELANLEWTLNPGEGAFYGPKLEFVLQDCLGRDWQCGTIQLDLNMPERFDMEYVGSDGQKHRPIMIHRAILGSLERFIGILIENFAGHFPLWLAPTQLVISGVTEKQNDFVEGLVKNFKQAGFRCEGDYRNEKINYKIREHMNAKASMVAIIGDREMEEGTITVRRLGSKAQTTYKVEEFMTMMREEIDTRALPPSFLAEQEKMSA